MDHAGPAKIEGQKERKKEGKRREGLGGFTSERR